MENHHFSWDNSLFLWPFSIAFCWFTGGDSLPMTCEIPNDFGPTSAAQASSEPPGSLGNARRFAGKIWGKIRDTKKTHGKTWEI